LTLSGFDGQFSMDADDFLKQQRPFPKKGKRPR